MLITPVILSGGSGTRLWPLSRKEYPKQYLSLLSDNTMLQETLLRLDGLDNITDPIIICNTEHRFIVAEQCQKINIKNPIILLEPMGKNTAPAIAAAALQAIKKFDDVSLLVLSTDHNIQNVKSFHRAIKLAFQQAQQGRLVTFGVVPTHANTAYGYIKSYQKNMNDACKVEEFVEKPDLETAQMYLEKGNYLWNSGMFMFKARTLIDGLKEYSLDIITSVTESFRNAEQDHDFVRLDKKPFEQSPHISIDYALMEKSDNVVVVPLDAGWSDVGYSWSTLYDLGKKDINGNVTEGDVFTSDTSNTYINANHHIVVTLGVENLIVVDTPDATLIATREKVEQVKFIVENLQSLGRDESLMNRKVCRPWGWYDCIEKGKNFQVKRLHVRPGSKLSLQKHYKRAEHWVVVSGTATAINGKETLVLTEGESTYIPIGVIHSLENQTEKQLEIIEIQSGVYLGEDDIVRYEDIYGRVKSE